MVEMCRRAAHGGGGGRMEGRKLDRTHRFLAWAAGWVVCTIHKPLVAP